MEVDKVDLRAGELYILALPYIDARHRSRDQKI